MELYFIKATYTNNVYKLDDFFTGSAYKQVATKKMDVNFKADDGVTEVVVDKLLPDNTDVKDHTHVIVPSESKIYRIVAADYTNTTQYRLTLDDDPLIANYQTLKNENIILNRTNDASVFNGILDISEVKTKKKSTLSRGTYTNPKTKLGQFALLFFQADTTEITLNFDSIRTFRSLEVFTSIASLLSTYPEVPTTMPDTYEYFLKTVYIDVLGGGRYQCIFTGSHLRWYKVDELSEVPVTISTGIFPYFYRSSYSDIPTLVVALPLRRDIEDGSGSKMHCFYDLSSINKPESLIDIKIVPDYFIGFDSFANTYDTITRSSVTTVNFKNSEIVYGGVSDQYHVIVTNNFVNTIDVSRFESLTIFDYQPFKKHYLQIFGERIEISPKYFSDLHIYFGLATGIVNYTVYFNNKENIIATGSFTNQVKWQADKLDQFYQQNPTYKEQFYLKMSVDSLRNIVGGVVGGSVIPGIGNVMGGALGLGSAMLDAGLSQINLNMQEKSLRLQPDQINGNNTDLAIQLENIFGIFWVDEEIDTDINGLTQMKTEYFLRGYPTSIVKKITDLTANTNDIFGSCIIIYGETKSIIKNEYVTGYINNKLANGVVFI